MLYLPLACHTANIVSGAVLFGWATRDAVMAKTTVARVCNGLLAAEGLLCFVVALFALAGLVLA